MTAFFGRTDKARAGLIGRRGVIGLAAAAVVAVGFGGSAQAADKMKVASIFSTPIEEPWVNQIHEALLKAHEEMGVEYKWAESVQSADYARVLREYARNGYKLITGDAFAAEDVVRRVAKEYPDVAFVFGSGEGPAEPNFSVYDNWIHEPAYLSGMIAGMMTKTNTVGSVAAMDIPEVDRLVNAFCQGAKDANKDVKCKVTFIGSFFDPPKAKEAALAQINAGVDAIFAERFGVIEAAHEKGHHRLLQYVRPVFARPRYGRHRPGLGHVADHPDRHQAGRGRRLYRAGLRHLLDNGEGRRQACSVPSVGKEAAAGRHEGGDGQAGRDPRRLLPRAGQRRHAAVGVALKAVCRVQDPRACTSRAPPLPGGERSV